MGQYYAALVRTEDGTRRVFDPGSSAYDAKHGAGAFEKLRSECHIDHGDGTFTYKPYPDEYYRLSDGVKLMENAWFLRPFVAGVLDEIHGRPARVAWVGDYAGEPEDYTLHPNFNIADLKACWGEYAPESEPFAKVPSGGIGGYLVNHDKGICIDLADAAREAEGRSAHGGAVHPLPILTAIGNGRGGGDYWGMNQDKVGTWAMDLLEMTDEVPDGIGVVNTEDYTFAEGDGSIRIPRG